MKKRVPYKKTKSLQQKYFHLQTIFHHDEQHGFISSVENIILIKIVDGTSVVQCVADGMPTDDMANVNVMLAYEVPGTCWGDDRCCAIWCQYVSPL